MTRDDIAAYLRGMASDAQGHAYVISLADAAVLGAAAVTLEDGTAARADLALRDAALAAVTAWAEEDDHHLSSCAVYLPFPTGTEPECSCDLRHLRAAITEATGEAT